MSESAGDWCLIESDPGVFTEMIKDFGCTGVQVEEIWSMDKAEFKNLEPIHGLIFLFKWVKEEAPSGPIVQDSRLDRIFFARQVINNACATQALLSLLFNCKHADVQLGETLTDFQEFVQSFDGHSKGLALSNAAHIRTVHNSFARQTLFELDDKSKNRDEDAFHFISYIPIEGRLYELDGLRQGPIDLGPIGDGQDWLDVVRPIIEKRMNRDEYSDGEIHFNLMALVGDRQRMYEQQLGALLSAGGAADESRQGDLMHLRMLIEEEQAKTRRYRAENIRRKHNYLPLIVELLKMLGERGQLMPLYEKARKRAAEKKQQQQQQQQQHQQQKA